MTSPSLWALSLVYWLHMLATIVWIGSLAGLTILFIPAARETLDSKTYAKILASIQRRLDPLGWISLVVLVGTGMFQMSASPNYQGFLFLNNDWAVAILLKHIAFAVMIGISAYLTWGLLPKLGRAALRQAQGQDASEGGRLLQQDIFLLRLNLILGVVVLALTALARAS